MSDSFQKFVVELQEMQTRAFALGLPVTAKMLNDAMNSAGWEKAQDKPGRKRP